MRLADDFFRSHPPDQIIDLIHTLASRIPWQEIEASLAHQLPRQVRAGKKIEDIGLFDSEMKVVDGGKSNAARPRLSILFIVFLLYLMHLFEEIDEGVVERYAETLT